MDRIQLYNDPSYLTKDLVLSELRTIAQIIDELESTLHEMEIQDGKE